MVGKKGMSPIIATILLIAFAVALGAMIMNWSSELVSGGALETACDKARIHVREPICYQDNKIKVDVQNTGETTIHTMIVRIVSGGVEEDKKIKGVNLEKEGVLRKELRSVRPESEFRIDLVPLVEVDEEAPQECMKPLHSTVELPACE